VDAKPVLQDTTASPQVESPPLFAAHPQRISLWRLAWIWFLIGLQSFGGGTATLFLIRRTAVERHHWLSPEDFTRDWALVQAAPGINLLCMTILVGRRVAGFGGALAALFGLMLPSVAITIVMTALYADLRHLPVIQAALRGIVPATVGLGLVLSVRMALPILAARGQEGRWVQIAYVLILVGSIAATLLWQLPVIVVLCGAGMLAGLIQWRHSTLAKLGQS
jgi:chromate transporter